MPTPISRNNQDVPLAGAWSDPQADSLRREFREFLSQYVPEQRDLRGKLATLYESVFTTIEMCRRHLMGSADEFNAEFNTTHRELFPPPATPTEELEQRINGIEGRLGGIEELMQSLSPMLKEVLQIPQQIAAQHAANRPQQPAPSAQPKPNDDGEPVDPDDEEIVSQSVSDSDKRGNRVQIGPQPQPEKEATNEQQPTDPTPREAGKLPANGRKTNTGHRKGRKHGRK